MALEFTILGRLPSLNEYTSANRSRAYFGAKMKSDSQKKVNSYIPDDMRNLNLDKEYIVSFKFYEPNQRRDIDNICGFAHKIILDTLTKANVIVDDKQKYIKGLKDEFYFDKNNPRIEVRIEKVGE